MSTLCLPSTLYPPARFLVQESLYSTIFNTITTSPPPPSSVRSRHLRFFSKLHDFLSHRLRHPCHLRHLLLHPARRSHNSAYIMSLKPLLSLAFPILFPVIYIPLLAFSIPYLCYVSQTTVQIVHIFSFILLHFTLIISLSQLSFVTSYLFASFCYLSVSFINPMLSFPFLAALPSTDILVFYCFLFHHLLLYPMLPSTHSYDPLSHVIHCYPPLSFAILCYPLLSSGVR